MEFYTVSVLLEYGAKVSLQFTRKEKATETFDKLCAKDRTEDEFEILVEDDYGSRHMVNRDKVMLISVEEPKRVCEGGIEMALIQNRANATANKRAASDPQLALLNPSMGVNGMMRT